MDTFRFTLYVTGSTPRTERAVSNLRDMCETSLRDHYELVIIDVLERPEVAESENILATPTLVKHAPLPIRRITGDLSSADRLRDALGLPAISTSLSGETA